MVEFYVYPWFLSAKQHCYNQHRVNQHREPQFSPLLMFYATASYWNCSCHRRRFGGRGGGGGGSGGGGGGDEQQQQQFLKCRAVSFVVVDFISMHRT